MSRDISRGPIGLAPTVNTLMQSACTKTFLPVTHTTTAPAPAWLERGKPRSPNEAYLHVSKLVRRTGGRNRAIYWLDRTKNYAVQTTDWQFCAGPIPNGLPNLCESLVIHVIPHHLKEDLPTHALLPSSMSLVRPFRNAHSGPVTPFPNKSRPHRCEIPFADR